MLCRHNFTGDQHCFTRIELVRGFPLSARYPNVAPLLINFFGWASIWVFNSFDDVVTVEAIALHAWVVTMVVSILAHVDWPTDVASGDVVLFVAFLLFAIPNNLVAFRALSWVVIPALVLT